MKKIIIVFGILMFNSCGYFEDNREIKQAVRTHLKKTLHNPKSLEEIDWFIFKRNHYKETDTINGNVVVDWEKTLKEEKEKGAMTNVILNYRAENGYGALRKNTFYCVYFHKHKDNESLIFYDGAKMAVLMSEFYLINSSKIKSFKEGYKLFLEEYPEFKD